mmetsp:Transcript_3474/g.4835  ORF Transcript_3474/g.4835 Transcript_3474/m.4835 type:complete len:198 (-) Transcript_3474:54-647(-)
MLTNPRALLLSYLLFFLASNRFSLISCFAFSIVPTSSRVENKYVDRYKGPLNISFTPFVRTSALRMSDGNGGGGGSERAKSKKKGLTTITIDKTETKSDQEEIKEEEWRVVLHNDEVHTFNYVIQSLCKVIGTLDRKRAFDICVLTHGSGKATITKCWKQQAMKYCLGLQRQGLTASIAPESRFSGEGGGEPDSGKS